MKWQISDLTPQILEKAQAQAQISNNLQSEI
jgi:hypothetical protein